MGSKFKFTISRKLTLAFFILSLVVIAAYIKIYNELEVNLQRNKKISQVYAPSTKYLNDMIFMMGNSKMLIKNWVIVEKLSGTKDKLEFQHLHDVEYDSLKALLSPLVEEWPQEAYNKYYDIIPKIETLFNLHEEIMDALSDEESYNDFIKYQTIKQKVVGQGEVIQKTDEIIKNLHELLNLLQEIVEKETKTFEDSFKSYENMILLAGILQIVTMILIALWLRSTLLGSLKELNAVVKKLGKGLLPNIRLKPRTDEIGEMADSLKVHINGLRKISEFATKIGEGEFSHSFEPLSEEDVLGNSLILMRDNLKKAEEEAELRKIENYQRNWASQGIAKFGEVVRNNSDSLEQLTKAVISELVSYLDAQLGGFYIVVKEEHEDENGNKYETRKLELYSFFAFDRNKYVGNKFFAEGEGLVGECLADNETIYLTDIPEGYVHITSGLGSDDPKALMIVPMKVNEEIYGVVEIASFKEFERYQIEFVEKIGETIASAISTVQAKILNEINKEKSERISEQLRKQQEKAEREIAEMQNELHEIQKKYMTEKEMREKLAEELRKEVTKYTNKLAELEGNMSKLNVKYSNLVFAIDASLGYYELNENFEFKDANTKYVKMLGTTKIDLINVPHNELLVDEFAHSKDYIETIGAVKSGYPKTITNHYFVNDNHKWFLESFVPIYESKDNISKVIVFAVDISENRLKEIELQQKMLNLEAQISLLRKAKK